MTAGRIPQCFGRESTFEEADFEKVLKLASAWKLIPKCSRSFLSF